ncbi:MAG TPA: endolytic transglycosylase MltG [Candidatus Cloacimonadota bacterium]|jgi:UPF0755 protein|nr:endolytic transglycosylase MltG [Candidatus Cloacimonadales bacterium]HPY95837.1 endolytic transglycosylase MltG [Candidatus Cloacimonadota bacterium]HQB40539.1 endolytic transglycosylase MltG [Candidatus Cloacimonadota bacterium]
MNKIALIIFTIFLLLLSFIALFYIMINIQVKADNRLFTIRNGQPARSISEELQSQGIIKSSFAFNVLVRLKKCDKQLKKGTYLFNGKISIKTAIEKIISGEIEVKQITIPEGLSMYATIRLINSHELGSLERMTELVNDSVFTRQITGFKVATLEGFLYPDTYIFNKNNQEEDILKKMVINLFARLHSKHIDIENKEQLYRILKLASIVEKEAVFNDEKPLIASVYINRLNKKMLLQADPTTTYHLEEYGIKKGKLYYSDLKIDTPFNTYKYLGLPPTPICSPAISTIDACINPDETDYLFFFAMPDRRHIFTKTYQEHLRKQREMKKV